MRHIFFRLNLTSVSCGCNSLKQCFTWLRLASAVCKFNWLNPLFSVSVFLFPFRMCVTSFIWILRIPGYLSSVLFIIQEGTVLSYDPISGAVSVELTKESLKKTQGKFGVVQKVNDEVNVNSAFRLRMENSCV